MITILIILIVILTIILQSYDDRMLKILLVFFLIKGKFDCKITAASFLNARPINTNNLQLVDNAQSQ